MTSAGGFMVGGLVGTKQELTKIELAEKGRLDTCSSRGRLLNLAHRSSTVCDLFGGRPAVCPLNEHNGGHDVDGR